MTTQTTKPERVAVGQRWRWDLEASSEPANPHPFEVLRVDGEYCYVSSFDQRDKTKPIRYGTDASLILREAIYLGPTKEPALPPVPAKGQRWRDTGKWTLDDGIERETPAIFGGEPFTLTKEGHNGAWHDDRSTSAWNIAHFTSGRLAFVDHGPPSKSTETGPVKSRSPHTCRHGNVGACRDCFVEFEQKVASPAPLTAFQILQAKEQARAAKREADARAVAAFVDFFDCLPDATNERR